MKIDFKLVVPLALLLAGCGGNGTVVDTPLQPSSTLRGTSWNGQAFGVNGLNRGNVSIAVGPDGTGQMLFDGQVIALDFGDNTYSACQFFAEGQIQNGHVSITQYQTFTNGYLYLEGLGWSNRGFSAYRIFNLTKN